MLVYSSVIIMFIHSSSNISKLSFFYTKALMYSKLIIISVRPRFLSQYNPQVSANIPLKYTVHMYCHMYSNETAM